MNARARWLGLATLLKDAVEHGSVAVERIHMATAKRPFAILERIPAIAAPVQLVHEVHDLVVTSTYKQIRFWSSAVEKVVQVALTEPANDSETPKPDGALPPGAAENKKPARHAQD